MGLTAKKVGLGALAAFAVWYFGGKYGDHRVEEDHKERVIDLRKYPDVRDIQDKSGTFRVGVDRAMSGVVNNVMAKGANNELVMDGGLNMFQVGKLTLAMQDEKLKDSLAVEIMKGRTAKAVFAQDGLTGFKLIPEGHEQDAQYNGKIKVGLALSPSKTVMTVDNPANPKGLQTLNYPHAEPTAANFDPDEERRNARLAAAATPAAKPSAGKPPAPGGN